MTKTFPRSGRRPPFDCIQHGQSPICSSDNRKTINFICVTNMFVLLRACLFVVMLDFVVVVDSVVVVFGDVDSVVDSNDFVVVVEVIVILFGFTTSSSDDDGVNDGTNNLFRRRFVSVEVSL